jgi:cytolethal distending toxin subunit A
VITALRAGVERLSGAGFVRLFGGHGRAPAAAGEMGRPVTVSRGPEPSEGEMGLMAVSIVASATEGKVMAMAKHRIKTISVLIAAMATAGTALSAPAAFASPMPPVPTMTTTWIVNANSDKCLAIAGADTSDNAPANQYTCDSNLSRMWYLVDRGDNRYWIKNYYTGKCLTIAGGGYDVNILANQYHCDAHVARLWYFEDKGNSQYFIRNYNSGKCLTIAGGGFGNNVYANQYTCDSHLSRRWYFVIR